MDLTICQAFFGKVVLQFGAPLAVDWAIESVRRRWNAQKRRNWRKTLMAPLAGEKDAAVLQPRIRFHPRVLFRSQSHAERQRAIDSPPAQHLAGSQRLGKTGAGPRLPLIHLSEPTRPY